MQDERRDSDPAEQQRREFERFLNESVAGGPGLAAFEEPKEFLVTDQSGTVHRVIMPGVVVLENISERNGEPERGNE
jgi:hypothetical protein